MTSRPEIRRGEVWWADLDAPRGSAPGYPRPVVVVQHDLLNASGIDSVLVTPFTSNLSRQKLPGNVAVGTRGTGLHKPSVAVGAHTVAMAREDLRKRLGRLPREDQAKLDAALVFVLGVEGLDLPRP